MTGAMTAVGAGGWALLSGGRANAYYQGPVSDHFDGVRFFNPNGVRPRGPRALLKWQLSDRGEAWPESYPSPFRDRPPARFDGDGVRIAFVGHATFLHSDARQEPAGRPGVGEARQPVLLCRPQAREPARHCLRGSAGHRCRARHPQPLRSHGCPHDRPAVSALAPARRHAPRQRHDSEGPRARTRHPRRRLA